VRGLNFKKTVTTIRVANGFDRPAHLAVKFKVLMLDELRYRGQPIPASLEKMVTQIKNTLTWNDAVDILDAVGVHVKVA